MTPKFKTKFFLLLLLCINTSCLAITDNLFGNFPDANFFHERFPYNKKSIVILKIHAGSKIEDKVWCRLDDEKLLQEVKSSSYCFKIKADNKNKMLMVVPGTYFLTNHHAMSNHQYLYDVKSSRNLMSGTHLVSFKAIAEKINYIGTIYEEGAYRQVENEFSLIKNLLAIADYVNLQKNFNNSNQDLAWLIERYVDSKHLFKNNLAEIDHKKDRKIILKNQRHFQKVKNSASLTELERSLGFLQKMINIEKRK